MHKIRRTTSVVLEQPGTEKMLVESVADASFSMDDVSYCVFILDVILL